MITAKISPTGQITLPRKVRQVLDLKPGERVVLLVESGGVLLRPIGSCKAKALAGSLHRYASVHRPPSRARKTAKEEVARAAAYDKVTR